MPATGHALASVHGCLSRTPSTRTAQRGVDQVMHRKHGIRPMSMSSRSLRNVSGEDGVVGPFKPGASQTITSATTASGVALGGLRDPVAVGHGIGSLICGKLFECAWCGEW